MPYAADGQISREALAEGIEITEQQYAAALAGMLAGDHVQLRGGQLYIGPLPEPEPELEQPTLIDWPARIAARRYAAEVAGIEVAGMRVETDDRSKLLINGAALEAMIDPEYVLSWKTAGGFVDLGADQVLGVARAVRAHVQACFNREATLLAQLFTEGQLAAEELESGWPGIQPTPPVGEAP